MKQLRAILIPLVLAYLTVMAAYVALQRRMIYHPVTLTGVTPAKYGLDDYKDISFASSDGTTLAGWWFKHPGPASRRPVLLYCHGNGDCLAQLAQVAKIFYDFGFDGMLFDYRDYGASGKGPLSEKALDGDALSAYRWLQARGVPERRIILWGHSLGSSVAAELATKVHPAGLILEGAFPSIQAVSRQRNPWLLVPSFLIWDKYDTGKYVTERTCPLLEFHAGKDTVIPIELGRKVFEMASPPKEWITIKGIDHSDFPSVAYQYEKPIREFTGKCLAAD